MLGFADYVTTTGNLEALRRWWNTLMKIGPNYDYYSQPCGLIVKEIKLEEPVRVIRGTNIQISLGGKQYLGAVLKWRRTRKFTLMTKSASESTC